MRKRILLIDDDIASVSAARRVLTEAGFDPILATNAADAEIALEHDDPQMVVLALATAGGSGLEICQSIRSEAADPALPILLVGDGTGDVVDTASALAAGGDGFFQRPVAWKRVVAKIESYLGVGEPSPRRASAADIARTAARAEAVRTERDGDGVEAAMDALLADAEPESPVGRAPAAARGVADDADDGDTGADDAWTVDEPGRKDLADELFGDLGEGADDEPTLPAAEPPEIDHALDEIARELTGDEAEADEAPEPEPEPEPDDAAEPAPDAEAAAAEAARLEAEERARREAAAKAEARRLLEERARKQAEAKARAKARLEAETRARREAEEKGRKEAEAQAKKDAEEAERRAAEAAAEAAAQAEREAEEAARREAEARAKKEAEEAERRAAEAAAEAAAQAEREAEEAARREAEARAKKEAEEAERRAAEAAAEAAAQAEREAEEAARREAEARAKKEAEEAERRAAEAAAEAAAQAEREAEEAARREAEARAKKEAEEAERRAARREAEALAAREIAAAEARSSLGDDLFDELPPPPSTPRPPPLDGATDARPPVPDEEEWSGRSLDLDWTSSEPKTAPPRLGPGWAGQDTGSLELDADREENPRTSRLPDAPDLEPVAPPPAAPARPAPDLRRRPRRLGRGRGSRAGAGTGDGGRGRGRLVGHGPGGRHARRPGVPLAGSPPRHRRPL